MQLDNHSLRFETDVPRIRVSVRIPKALCPVCRQICSMSPSSRLALLLGIEGHQQRSISAMKSHEFFYLSGALDTFWNTKHCDFWPEKRP
jgi:hypothetical protein